MVNLDLSRIAVLTVLLFVNKIRVSSSSSSSSPKTKVTPDNKTIDNNSIDGECSMDVECVSSKEENESKAQNSVHSYSSQCGVYLAMSTLPGTGIGMFAGKNFEKGESIMSLGDHIIPIVDLEFHHPEAEWFLWDEYTWNSGALRIPSIGVDEVNVASPGFGAAANSFLDFVNVAEGYPVYSVAGKLHRSKDPGVGAFTYFHSRWSTAEDEIIAGQELFVSYGSNWFLEREKLGPIPIDGSHNVAEKLYRRFKARFWKKSTVMPAFKVLLDDFWKTIVLDNFWESRIFAALPPFEDHEAMITQGLKELKRQKMVRSVDWLEEHGVCADNMYMDVSTMPQAGHGAFAIRPLDKDTIILPVPLIHIPDREILELYDFNEAVQLNHHRTPNKTKLAGHQLLLNYCMGHRESTMVLSPYGPVFNMINHNQTFANVKLQWASPERSNHQPEMLEKGVAHFDRLSTSVLAMELIALRDIKPGEEIFLDYGDEWEAAWQNHLATWEPIEGAEKYVAAWQLNESPEPLMTVFEAIENPYPENVVLKMNMAFATEKTNENAQITEEMMDDYFYVFCEILRRREGEKQGEYLYAVTYKQGVDILLEDVPRFGFKFEDLSSTTDIFNSNAFRHDIRIPDELFPKAWKNIGQNIDVAAKDV